jgi:hypothetical protein
MKKITTLLAALLAFIVNQPLQAQQKDSKDNSLLWRISGKGLTKPSYLFGTIHLICENDYLWTDKMKQSLSNSEKVCFEMDLDDPNVMMQVANGLIDTSGKKLKDYFTQQQYEQVLHYFQDTLGMSLAMFQQMKPIALQTFLGTKNSDCTHPISYEEVIMEMAVKEKKEIIGLEEPKEQIAVLESIPVDTVIQQLMDEIQHKDKAGDDSDYNRLISAYKKQELPTLYSLITGSKDLGDNLDAFLDVRNKKWILRMPEKMKKSSVFFAVGAGHLWGPNGVINLLRKEGYSVEPLK